MKNTIKTQLAIPSMGGFTYFRFSKDFAIPSKHTRTSCLQPMFIGNTLTQEGDKYFNCAFINLLQ
jgi:hypothetical protein